MFGVGSPEDSRSITTCHVQSTYTLGMHRALALRRVASGLFVVALVALLVVPVGSAARLPQTQAAAGSTHSKATASAARTHQASSHFNPSDRFQLDPVTPPDVADELTDLELGPIEDLSQPSAEGERTEPTVRGPPAL